MKWYEAIVLGTGEVLEINAPSEKCFEPNEVIVINNIKYKIISIDEAVNYSGLTIQQIEE